jgi:hypothetical protein
MKNVTEKTKEELLVENAVLKYNEQVRQMLKEELSPLNSKMAHVAKRVDNLEERLKEVDNIVEPFGIIRRRFWIFVISVTIVAGVAGSKITDWIGTIGK